MLKVTIADSYPHAPLIRVGKRLFDSALILVIYP